ncbi:MAG: response regulator [Pricia sp.]
MKLPPIYLAEDDVDDRELFVEAISDLGIKIEIRQFENGIDLMDALFTTDILPRIIFLDLRMPLMSGFECLTDIRNFRKFNGIHVIVYSAAYHEREVRQLRNDGANGYLQKPSSYADLKSLLYQIVVRSIDSNKSQQSKTFKFLSKS